MAFAPIKNIPNECVIHYEYNKCDLLVINMISPPQSPNRVHSLDATCNNVNKGLQLKSPH